MITPNYYIKAIPSQSSLWYSRQYKTRKAPAWHKLKKSEIENVLKTHKYTMDIYPQNDDTCINYTFDVKVMKVTKEFV